MLKKSRRKKNNEFQYDAYLIQHKANVKNGLMWFKKHLPKYIRRHNRL